MKNSSVVLTVCLFLLFIVSYSCAKEKAGTKEPPPVQTEPAVEKTVNPDPDPKTQAVTLGNELYTKHCKVCHGTGGKGGVGPSLIDNEWKYGSSDDELFLSIAQGRPGGMPSWDHTLDENNIRSIMAYIRSIGKK